MTNEQIINEIQKNWDPKMGCLIEIGNVRIGVMPNHKWDLWVSKKGTTGHQSRTSARWDPRCDEIPSHVGGW